MLENASPEMPKTSEEWADYARDLQKSRQPKEALAAAVTALKLDPKRSDMWDFIGLLLLAKGRWQEAARYLYEAKNLAPESAIIRSHYAIALMEEGQLSDAYQEIKTALKADPKSADALYVKGEIFCRTGHYDLAIVSYRAARENKSLRHAATFGEAFGSFITSNFEAGMELMVLAEPVFDPMPLLDWKGVSSPDLHLVLCGEYGFGDLIQFIRYVPYLKRKVRQVTLSLPYALMRLIKNNFPEYSIYVYHVPESEHANLPPLVSETLPQEAGARCFYDHLPHFLGPPFDPLARNVPYIKADPTSSAAWSEKFASVPRPRIAIAWSGNSLNQNNHNRSIPFEELRPLIDLAGPHLISFQRDGQIEAAKAGIFDATPFISDFADSAAAMAEVDLVISVCSAPAHLAGAMGKPVWTLLAFNADWRWLIGREDSIWYPTMRLFRQPEPKAWSGVIEKVLKEVEALLSGKKDVLEPPIFKGPVLKRNAKAIQLASFEDDLR